MDTVPNQLLQHFVEPVQLVIEFGSTRCATRPDQTRLQNMLYTLVERPWNNSWHQRRSQLYIPVIWVCGVVSKIVKAFKAGKNFMTSNVDLSLWMQRCKPNRSVDFLWTTSYTKHQKKFSIARAAGGWDTQRVHQTLLDPQGWLVISLKQTAAFSGKIWIRLDTLW